MALGNNAKQASYHDLWVSSLYLARDVSRRHSPSLSKLFRTLQKYVITVCPRSSDPFYIVTYYIKWVTTSWTHSLDKQRRKILTVVRLSIIFHSCLLNF